MKRMRTPSSRGILPRRVLSCALLGPLLLAGCKHFGLDDRPVPVQHTAASTTSGLVYEEQFVGKGPEARIGDDVTFDYTVWLQDGKEVDSTHDRGVPVTVRLGSAPLRAWDEGLVGIRPQGRRRLVVPPALAYGEKGVEGMVPPNATLIIEVLALEVRPAGEAQKH
jgi:FKBP-type peptidyl-prolyl cis-trans isomerase